MAPSFQILAKTLVHAPEYVINLSHPLPSCLNNAPHVIFYMIVKHKKISLQRKCTQSTNHLFTIDIA